MSTYLCPIPCYNYITQNYKELIKYYQKVLQKERMGDLSTFFRTHFLSFLYYFQNVTFFVQIQQVTYNLNKNVIFYGYTKFQ